MKNKNIFVACDVSSQKEILDLLELIHEDISGIKIGLQYITQRSPEEIRELSKFIKAIFYDGKFFDIKKSGYYWRPMAGNDTIWRPDSNLLKFDIEIFKKNELGGEGRKDNKRCFFFLIFCCFIYYYIDKIFFSCFLFFLKKYK